MKESLWDYILYNSKRFKIHVSDKFDFYIETIFEDGKWWDEQEIVDFLNYIM